MEATIRTATEADLPAILRIMNHAILHTTAVYDYDIKDEAFINNWFADKRQNNYPVIVATAKGEIAGYGSYAQFKAKDGYKFCVEHSVYVAEEWQGKGIGRLLLTALIDNAKANGMHSMVGLIDADNTISIVLHKKLGFTEAGLLQQAGFKFNRWLNVQFMQLLLD